MYVLLSPAMHLTSQILQSNTEKTYLTKSLNSMSELQGHLEIIYRTTSFYRVGN